MTTATTPSDLLATASFRVLRGAPTPEELAAFTAVLTLRTHPPAAAARPVRATATWARPERAGAYNCPRAWHV